jgi:GNAT superfamily N-acetyltransferase
MEMKIQIETAPRPQDEQRIRDGLMAYNAQHVGADGFAPLSIFVRDDDEAICGGLLAETFWQWLHISALWVDKKQRNQGLGGQLLQQAEEEALRRGCLASFVDTFDFQAPDFYERHGYKTWGQLDDLPPGHRRIFFQKQLFTIAK